MAIAVTVDGACAQVNVITCSRSAWMISKGLFLAIDMPFAL